MGANIAGIYGAQIFRSDDAPRYRRGFSINIAVLTVGLTLAIVRFFDDKWLRRRTANEAERISDGASDELEENESERGTKTAVSKEKSSPVSAF